MLRTPPYANVVNMAEKLTVGIIIYDKVEVLDFTGPLEVFSATRYQDKPLISDPSPFEVFLVGEYPRPIITQGGMRVIPQHTFNYCPPLDILVVPGGLGEREEHENKLTLRFIRNQAKEIKTLASVCTGAFFLAKAGLLDGRKATTHFQSIDRLREQYPNVDVVENTRFVEDGNILTSAGISAGIDMALRIVEIHLGADTARTTAHLMEYDYNSE